MFRPDVQLMAFSFERETASSRLVSIFVITPLNSFNGRADTPAYPGLVRLETRLSLAYETK
jgi:hypothetical protein